MAAKCLHLFFGVPAQAMVGQHGSHLGPCQITGNGLIHAFQDLDHKSCIHGYWLLPTALCVSGYNAISFGLHAGWFGKTKWYDFFGGTFSFKCFWPWRWLLVWQVHMLKQHLSLRIWSIQGTFSTRCFKCAKTKCTKSTCFNIALSAPYTQGDVTSLNKLHMEHVDCFSIPCNSLCHSKIHVIFISKSTTHPWILKSSKYFCIQKSWKILMQIHFLMDSNV